MASLYGTSTEYPIYSGKTDRILLTAVDPTIR